MTSPRLMPQQPISSQEEWRRYYYDLKSTLMLPDKGIAFLDCLAHQADPSLNCPHGPHTQTLYHKCPYHHFQHRFFCRGFSQLSKAQKQQYIIKVIELVKTIDERTNQSQTRKESRLQCSLKDTKCFIPHWEKTTVVVNFQLKKISLQNQSATLHLLLAQYLPRISKKHHSQLILQFIGPVPFNKQQIRLSCSKEYSNNFRLLYETLLNAAVQCQVSKLATMMSVSKRNTIKGGKKRQIHIFLTSTLIDECCRRRIPDSPLRLELESASMLPQPSVNGDYTVVKVDSKMTIYCIQSHPFLYRSSYSTLQPPSYLKIGEFLQKYSNSHRMIFQTKELEHHAGKNCQIVVFYQKMVLGQRIFSQLLMMYQHKERSEDAGTILYFRNIDQPQNLPFIQKMEISNRKVKHDQFQVTVEVEFGQQREFKPDFFVSYCQLFKQTFSISTTRQTRYHKDAIKIKSLMNLYRSESTIAPSYLQQQIGQPSGQEQDTNMIFTSRQLRSALPNQHPPSQSIEQLIISDEFSCLKHRYRLQPSAQKIGVIMKEHFLWRFWKRQQDGGLVCKDEELVERQKQVAKVVIAKFGENIIRGKNIINFSLPVVVFKKESHLQSLAKSFLYSPVFIERSVLAKDPLERMKNAIVMMMTQNALSIHMEKPFNPILGQTYQGYIDGCPIYLEQISHHPPVSAYYFAGRGYKKYGSIEPQVSVGLNKGSGFSLNPHYIEYEDGMKIEYICAKIVIGGILIGERTFKFQDRIYAYDRQHQLFASMKFGPIEEGLFSSSPQPQDYFHGNIYKVSEQFQKRFYSTMPRPHPKKDQIVSKKASFDGIWNSYVRIDNEEVVNFMTDLPYMFQYENYPLPSDCRFREDRRELVRGDLQRAQEAKQRLEDQQRHDRKLRQKYTEGNQ